MKKFLFLLTMVCLFAMVSCEKDQDINPSVPANDVGVGTPDPGDSGDQLKISSSTILNATSASQIPSQFFRVDPVYKLFYLHHQQPDGVSCSWTSYVNCVNCIVSTNNNYCYNTSISTVRHRCEYHYPLASQNGANSILALEWHAGTYDYSDIAYYRKSTSNRWEATKRMLAHINSRHTPFIVRGSMNGTGHFLVAFSIDWKQSESASMVYYTDCWYANAGSFDSNIRSMSLYNFLNRMKLNATYYNMLFMWSN